MLPEHEVLFEPVRIGPKVLRNRFYQVPHGLFGSGKPLATAAYRELRAEGGWAAVNTQQAAVDPHSDDEPLPTEHWWSADDAELYRPLVEGAHRHGALAGIELMHGGAFAQRRGSRFPALAPSGIAAELGPRHLAPETPREMDQDDIGRVQQAFVDGAVRARDAGFDIIYAYGGHGYLFAQFLSPFHNRRTDRYGGSLENRARMWLETLGRMRDAVGADCAIATRIASDALGPHGVNLEETHRFIEMADELVDLWDITLGAHLNMAVDMGASRFHKEGYQMEWTARLRSATRKPVIGVSRFTSPDTMARLVRDGVIDIVGAARASIADPFLPDKTRDGRPDEIRECMGVNACTSRWLGGQLGCAQNATAGEEHRRGWHPERFEQVAEPETAVLVVGAGPAGLECATVLARRGVGAVHLVDASPAIGGSLARSARLPGLAEWGRFIDHRQTVLAKHDNVRIILGRELGVEDILAYGADTVILATGSHWARDGLNGPTHEPLGGIAEHPHRVLLPEDLMNGRRPEPGRRVVVYDAEGYHMAATLTDLLSAEGYEVCFVTSCESVAPWCEQTFESDGLRRRLHDRGVTMSTGVVLTEVGDRTVSGVGEFGEPFALPYDVFVPVTQRVPDDSLYRALRADQEGLAEAGIRRLVPIGDCVAPRLLADVVFEAHRVAREIESVDPRVPLPYKRERSRSR
ncbi:FAD-dependent oxidoreductase [Streptomyces olivaceus]|uniref:oxidoreductase n=1 Tax=Streptomyces olivaceus TaxID=47716 RepID=UPI001CCD25A3|nr:FAD-dependent oxidoreductase [Streptomyces olivaceus]MBZ6083675.1 FAD-dependent oxidoreductase [Streptomyces olivaceus]